MPPLIYANLQMNMVKHTLTTSHAMLDIVCADFSGRNWLILMIWISHCGWQKPKRIFCSRFLTIPEPVVLLDQYLPYEKSRVITKYLPSPLLRNRMQKGRRNN